MRIPRWRSDHRQCETHILHWLPLSSQVDSCGTLQSNRFAPMHRTRRKRIRKKSCFIHKNYIRRYWHLRYLYLYLASCVLRCCYGIRLLVNSQCNSFQYWVVHLSIGWLHGILHSFFFCFFGSRFVRIANELKNPLEESNLWRRRDKHKMHDFPIECQMLCLALIAIGQWKIKCVGEKFVSNCHVTIFFCFHFWVRRWNLFSFSCCHRQRLCIHSIRVTWIRTEWDEKQKQTGRRRL